VHSRTGADRQRDRRLITAAVGLSAAGDALAVFPLAAIIASLTGSGVAVAGLFAALWAPSAVLAHVAGRLVDRIENTRLLRTVSALQLVTALAMIPLVDSVPGILIVATLLGTGHAIAQAAEFALIPAIADGRELQRLNGGVETARYVGMTVGPIAGGLIAALAGVEIALLCDAATFAFVVFAARRLTARRAPAEAAATGAAGPRAQAGFALLFGREPLRSVMIAAAVALVLMTTVWAAEPFFAQDVLGAGELGYSALFSSWMLGMAIGAKTLSRTGSRARCWSRGRWSRS
jgi:Na+/melibiose symporter-like transporter